jgi:uncharacterized protein (TIGR00251 family)
MRPAISYPAGVRITVRAHPAAIRERLVWDGNVLHVWVTAPATEGAANRAIVQALARAFDLPSSAVTLVIGGRGRHKVVEIAGIGAERLTERTVSSIGSDR